MARTTLTPVSVPGPYATAGAAVTWTAADTVNFNRIRLTGKEMLLVRNVNASTTAHTVTITSVALNGRSGDVTAQSIAAGAVKVFQIFPLPGWRQADGYLYLQGNHAEIEFAVLRVG